MTGRIVAIDGPAGVGKSSVSREVARRLGVPYLDTGAMYRAVTYAVIHSGVDPGDGDGATKAAEAAEIVVDEQCVTIDGKDATSLIRGADVTKLVSKVSAHPGVRSELRTRQRSWMSERAAGVMEGRDIGSVILPDADVKIFLTARPEVRAQRRHGELSGAELAEVATDLARRDEADANRAVSPMRPADDAVVLDTSDLTLDEVIEKILELVNE
jgi:CMP/dCMP kinase